MRWADIFVTLSLACIAFADKPLRCPDIFVLIYVSSLTRLWPVRKVGFSRAWHWFPNFGVLLYVCKIVQWEMLMEALHCLKFTYFSSSRIMDARYYGLFYENINKKYFTFLYFDGRNKQKMTLTRMFRIHQEFTSSFNYHLFWSLQNVLFVARSWIFQKPARNTRKNSLLRDKFSRITVRSNNKLLSKWSIYTLFN